jgi:hypothetical protein
VDKKNKKESEESDVIDTAGTRIEFFFFTFTFRSIEADQRASRKQPKSKQNISSVIVCVLCSSLSC